MKNCWELFPAMFEAVKRRHALLDKAGHHPFEHAVIVAQYAIIIAPDSVTGILAAAAGLIHNEDHLLGICEPDVLEGSLRAYLVNTPFTSDEKDEVVCAALNHTRGNSPHDNPTTICLQDADRLANICPLEAAVRTARSYPGTFPIFHRDYIMTREPGSTYQNPRSVMHMTVHEKLVWEKWLRLPKAQELARKYFDGLRLLQSLTEVQIIETSLRQCPL